MGVHFSPHSQLPMLVMEYLPLSLTQCLETHQDLPLQIKYSILLDVAKGLNYLHCKRPPIVHRDLTANNILLTSNFIAKISDLGVSRMADTFKQRQLTTAPGNWNVMPPEALKDNPNYDHKLDVFSYGCLILHVFTHQWPAPTAQYVPSINFFQRIQRSYHRVTEWTRRSKYTTTISSDNPFLPFAKCCLDNDPKKRPTMSDAIICAEHAVSSLPPIKNTLEMMKNIDLLTERVNQLERQVEQEKKQAEDDAHREKKEAKQLEKDKCQLLNELTKSWELKVMTEKNIAEKSDLLVHERSKVSELQSSLSSLQKSYDKLQSVLISKDDTIEVLRAQCKGIVPSCQVQKEMIQHLLTQELKEGDEW